MHSRDIALRPTRRGFSPVRSLPVRDSSFRDPPWPSPRIGRHARRSRAKRSSPRTREEFRAEIEEELGLYRGRSRRRRASSTPTSTTSRPFILSLPTMPPHSAAVWHLLRWTLWQRRPHRSDRRPTGLADYWEIAPDRPHLHLPPQQGREVARRYRHHRSRCPILLRRSCQSGARLGLRADDLLEVDRVLAGDRRAHLRGRRQGATRHLSL